MKMENRNRKQKCMGNKGFSLVELIIVIAIMAILVGVLAPQMIRYVERTRVSADTQLADTVRTAIRTAMLDPVVLEDDDSRDYIAGITGTDTNLDDLAALATPNAFVNAVAATLGVAVGDLDEVDTRLQSAISAAAPAGATLQIMFTITPNDVTVTIDNSDDGAGAEIVVPRP